MKICKLLLASTAAVLLGALASAQGLGGVGTVRAPKAPARGPVVLPEPSAVNYCTSRPNSTGHAAVLTCTGDLGVCHDRTCLTAMFVPSGGVGMFLYGSAPGRIPMFDGLLCIDPANKGLLRLGAVVSDNRMCADLQLRFDSLPANGRITAGSTWYFQYYFRDAAAGGAGANFSDGLKITFCN